MKEGITAADITQNLGVSGIRRRAQSSKIGTLPLWESRRIRVREKNVFD